MGKTATSYLGDLIMLALWQGGETSGVSPSPTPSSATVRISRIGVLSKVLHHTLLIEMELVVISGQA